MLILRQNIIEKQMKAFKRHIDVPVLIFSFAPLF
jgi:hypothetical protein